MTTTTTSPTLPNNINGTHVDPPPPQTNPSSPQQPLQLSLPLPHHPPGSLINLHLTLLPTTLLLFITTSSSSSSSTSSTAASSSPMGSFVYAIPDRLHPPATLTTPLYTSPSTQDFSTRLARTLARRTQRPVHVASSADFSGGAGGGSVEEETEAFVAIVGAVMRVFERQGRGPWQGEGQIRDSGR